MLVKIFGQMLVQGLFFVLFFVLSVLAEIQLFGYCSLTNSSSGLHIADFTKSDY